jgi:hypothetical protein
VIDTLRFKLDEYYADQTPGFNITVYDLKTSTAWNLYSGKVTDPHVPNLLVAYEQMVQYTLGSSLKNPYRLVAQEFVGGVRCNVFEDSTGYKEWVWIEHPIPIQRFSPGTLRRDGIFQISTVQLRDLVINVSLPDSIFMPPEPLALPNKRL